MMDTDNQTSDRTGRPPGGVTPLISMGRRGLVVSLLCWLVPTSGKAQTSTEEKGIVDSFKTYVQLRLQSYKKNPHERVSSRPSGVVRVYFEPVLATVEMDVQRNNSLVSPYVAQCNFQLVEHRTKFHESRDAAVADSTFVDSRISPHYHRYAYQDGKWIPKVRQNKPFFAERSVMGALADRLFDCTEVVVGGPDAGEADAYGCMEEYDDARR
jgi:hypothetical protein